MSLLDSIVSESASVGAKTQSWMISLEKQVQDLATRVTKLNSILNPPPGPMPPPVPVPTIKAAAEIASPAPEQTSWSGSEVEGAINAIVKRLNVMVPGVNDIGTGLTKLASMQTQGNISFSGPEAGVYAQSFNEIVQGSLRIVDNLAGTLNAIGDILREDGLA